MFERYTEMARRAIFFARYEASQLGSPYIETEHLLLGVLRTDTPLAIRLLGPTDKLEMIRGQIARQSPERPRLQTSVDLPLSHECKRVLAYASEEAERLNQKNVGAEHLLLGLSREEGSVAAKILSEHGLTEQKLKEEAKRASEAPPVNTPEGLSLVEKHARDLTSAARRGQLGALVGRERELERTIQILSRRTRNNPVLIGEAGVGKTAIVEGLAQRVVDGAVPAGLRDRPILTLDATQLIAPRGSALKPFLLSSQRNEILCVEGLFDLAGTGSGWGVTEAIRILEPYLNQGALQSIATGTPSGLRQTLERAEILARHFEAIPVLPLSDEEALQVVSRSKEQLERFHEVTFGEGALQLAITASARFLKHRHLPDRALDLLDEAGARAKMRRQMEPAEISRARQRVRDVIRQLENAIGNHEFDKARELSEEEKIERGILKSLQEAAGRNPAQAITVTPDDILEILAQRTGAPVASVQLVLQQPIEDEFNQISKSLAARIPGKGQEWIAGLAAYLVPCSADEAEKLAEAIRLAKAKK